MNLADRGGYKKEFYCFHAQLSEGKHLIITEKRIIKIALSVIESVEGRYVTAFNYPKRGKLFDLVLDTCNLKILKKMERKNDRIFDSSLFDNTFS